LRPSRISRGRRIRLSYRRRLAGSFAVAFAPFYRRLEILKSLTSHGLPYVLITEP
jgi:hypothetical protein